MERGRSPGDDRDTPPVQEGERPTHAIPPEGPLHRDDRDEAAWLDEPSKQPRADPAVDQRRSMIPTLLLVAAVALIVAVMFLL